MNLTFGLHIDQRKAYDVGDLICFTGYDIEKYPGLAKIGYVYHTITNIQNNLVELNKNFWLHKYVFEHKWLVEIKKL